MKNTTTHNFILFRLVSLFLLPSLLLVFSPYAQAEDSAQLNQKIVEDLNRQKKEVAQKQKDLEKREQELTQKEAALKLEISRLEELKKSIEGVQAKKAEQNEEKLAKLVETLENMSPKAAAAMLSQTEINLVIESLRRLSSPKTAKILSNLSPELASEISEGLAGKQNATRAKSQNSIEKGGEKNANTKNRDESSLSRNAENQESRKE